MRVAKRVVEPMRSEADAAGDTMPSGLVRVAHSIIAVMLVLMPLASLPPTVIFYNALDTPRRLMFLLCSGLLLALGVKAWSERRRVIWRQHFLDLPVVLYLLGAVLSSLGAVYPRVAFTGPLWSQDSLLLIVISVALFFGVKEFLRTPRIREDALVLVVLMGGVSAVIGYTDFFFGLSINPNFTAPTIALSGRRMVATLGNPMFTATYMAMLVPLAVGMAVATANAQRRRVMLICAGLLVPAMLMTMTRAAWLGFAVGTIFMTALAVWQLRTQPRLAWRVVTIFAGICGAIGMFAMLYTPVRTRLMGMRNDHGTLATRQVYMQTAWNIFLAHPIQGAGPGNLKIIFPQYRPFSKVIESGLPLNRGYNTAYPHNILLYHAGEMGLLGLLPFLLLVGAFYVTGFRLLRGSPAQAWAAIGILGMNTVNLVTNMFSFDNSATTNLFWIGMAVLASMTATDGTPSQRFPTLAAPLTHKNVSRVHLLYLAIGIGTCLNFLLQSLASINAMAGANTLAKVQQVMRTNPKAGYELAKVGISELQTAIDLTPVKDNIAYQLLFMGRIVQRDITGDASHYNLYNQEMFKAGEQTLALLERDPIVLRYLMMQYTESGTDTALQRAKALSENLLRFEPRSAEALLISADVYEKLGDVPHAILLVERAIALDENFAETQAKMGYLLNLLIEHNAPGSDKLVGKARASYEKAGTLGIQLSARDLMYYTTDLYILNQVETGVSVGRSMRASIEEKIAHNAGDPRDMQFFDMLCQKVDIIYRTRNKPELARAIISRMREGAQPVEVPAAPNLPAPTAPSAPRGAQGPAAPWLP